MFSLYYGFWDYWNLYHKVTFDGVNKIIWINEGVTQIDVQKDIYSSWKEWLLLETNTKYLQAIDTVGGEPTIQGQFLDVTYFLINGWKLKPQPGSYTLNIIGNIFDIDGGQIFEPAKIDPLLENNININTNTSVIVRQVRNEGSDVDLTQIENDLEEKDQKLFSIENRLISIETLFNSPIEAKLEQNQEEILIDIYRKVVEMWSIHGLDPNNEIVINNESRKVNDIIQDITTLDDEVTIKRRST